MTTMLVQERQAVQRHKMAYKDMLNFVSMLQAVAPAALRYGKLCSR